MDDHARGCQGREYTCTCGFDDSKDTEIERLREVITHAYQQIVAMRSTTPGNGKDGHIWQSLKPIKDLLFEHSGYGRGHPCAISS